MVRREWIKFTNRFLPPARKRNPYLPRAMKRAMEKEMRLRGVR